MEFVRLYTVLLTHRKQLATPPREWKALTMAWIYAGAHETDGRIPPEALTLIGATPKVSATLEELGWWHRNGDGYVLNDWDDHQEAAADIKRKRALARARKRNERQKKKEATDGE